MATPRLQGTEAIVLKRTDLGEADKILTIYTPHMGKRRVVAKGVRRTTSRLGGHVELFIHSRMLLAKGRNMDIVTQSETANAFIELRDDLWRMTYGYYVAELLDQLTEDSVENTPLFELLLTTLQRIATDRRPELAVRFFEIRTLDLLGYRPELQQCVQCRRPLAAVTNCFHTASGGVMCPQCGRQRSDAMVLSLPAFKLLRLLQNGDYATASRVRIDIALARELETILRSHIQYILERELKSTAFLNSLRAIAGPAEVGA